MSRAVVNVTSLVMFSFTGETETLRTILFTAIEMGVLPDYVHVFGTSTGRYFTGLWNPLHADDVRKWARSVGIEVKDV